MKKLNLKMIEEAKHRLEGIVLKTPLQLNERLSEKYGAKIYLKREDLQSVRSYKIRGAYNKISSLSLEDRKKGVVCASAGNHAQGVAWSCAKLKIKGFIYMPKNTPKQKIERVRNFGKEWIDLCLVGETFDDAFRESSVFCKKEGCIFVHPFNDIDVIAGQATVGAEILEKLEVAPDFVIVPIGGGGLVSGVGSYFKLMETKTKIIGIEPDGATAMFDSLKLNKLVELKKIDKFADGVAVKKVGDITLSIAKNVIDKIVLVPEGKICVNMIELYQSEGIVTEPAGALSVSSLDSISNLIKGKVVVCVISGGNNDISRYPEIVERSLQYRGLKHYFIVDFPQVPGTLRKYLDSVLGPNDDITLFEYMKKSNRESGPVLIGLEFIKPEDLESLLDRMAKMGFSYQKLEDGSSIRRFLI